MFIHHTVSIVLKQGNTSNDKIWRYKLNMDIVICKLIYNCYIVVEL